MKIAVLIILVILSSSLGMAQAIFTPQGSVEELGKLSKEKPENMMLSDAQDIPQFCRINAYRDAANTMVNGAISNWGLSFIADYNFRIKNLLSNYLDDSELELGIISHQKLLSDLAKLKKIINETSDVISPAAKFEFQSSVRAALLRSPDQAKDFDGGISQLIYLCSDITLSDLRGCVQGLSYIKKIAKPVGLVNLIPVWNEIIQHPAYIKVYKRVALKMMDDLINERVPSSNMFDDLKVGFESEVGDSRKAEDMTWKTMGALASGGANAYIRPEMLDPNFHEMNIFLFVLTQASLVLDRVTSSHGFLYTFPKAINNLCDNGKNYHFWMTAFLARENF